MVAGDGDVKTYCRLARVCRQFRDVSRASPASLAEAPAGILLRGLAASAAHEGRARPTPARATPRSRLRCAGSRGASRARSL